MADKNFTIEGRRLAKVGDVQRNWLFELVIPGIASIAPGIVDVEDFIIRCRTATIPSRGNEVIESNFMSMKQYFMGKPIIEPTFTTTLEEFEDQKVMKFIYSWRQAITNIHPDLNSVTPIQGPVPGAAAFPAKRMGLSKTAFLRMYKFDGSLMENQIEFINMWPENVDAVTLDYAGTEAIKYNVTWRSDFWRLVKA